MIHLHTRDSKSKDFPISTPVQQFIIKEELPTHPHYGRRVKLECPKCKLERIIRVSLLRSLKHNLKCNCQS